MGIETFLRLPQEKRERFLDAAWAEFSRVPFAKASVNQIVLRARIPRGSFYQYFQDKKALFVYLLDGMLEHFLAEYRQVLQQANGDLFAAQIICFDRIMQQDLDTMFLRGMDILRLNGVLLMQKMSETPTTDRFWEAVSALVDFTPFRSEDAAKEAFAISLMILVVTLADALAHPEQEPRFRQELALRLEVLKYGSYQRTEDKETMP